MTNKRKRRMFQKWYGQPYEDKVTKNIENLWKCRKCGKTSQVHRARCPYCMALGLVPVTVVVQA